jgi:hypothetical protein
MVELSFADLRSDPWASSREWAWCSALAPLLAASRVMRGAAADEIAALLALAP